MRSRSTLALIAFTCYKINPIKGKFVPKKSVPVTFAILLICSTVKSELYSLSEMRLSSATKRFDYKIKRIQQLRTTTPSLQTETKSLK